MAFSNTELPAVPATESIASTNGIGSASATFISVAETQLQTSDGQEFNFSFASLPNPGTNGSFSLKMRGDYSGFNSESSLATIDIAGGLLDVGNTANGVISNTISGLSLSSSNKTTFTFDDVQWDFMFTMSDILLNQVIFDSVANFTIDLDPGVHNFATSSFVSVGLDYESVSVPEPSIIALFAAGLFGIGFARRRRTHN